jgi:hypothetical protein
VPHWRRSIPGIGLLAALCAAVAPADAFEAFSSVSDSSAAADSADGRRAAHPTIVAKRIHSGEDIRLDGRLDDSAWGEGEAARGFRVWDPDRGAIPTQETVFKIVYDDGAVYFGVACYEKDPSKISAKLSRRGHRIVEVPIRYQARTSNEGKKIRWTDAVVAAWTLLKYRVRE